MSGGNYTFGPFSFDGDRQLLLKHGCPVVLGQRGTALLGALLQARGMPVTKSELMDVAWPDLHVEESNLSVQIASLRKTLGKSQSGNDWIETVQRSGYRFSEVSEKQSATAALPFIAKSNGATLAILPFTNLSSDTEQGFFADGLTEDLITVLAKVPGMTVTARHSSFHFRGADPLEAATLLGVRYVAGGSVRRSSDRLRITAELTDTELARTLWSERFDRKIADIFDAQDEIAQQIATYIFSTVAPVHLKGRYRSPSLEAYELVVKSRWISVESLSANRQAHSSYSRAIELDPDYAEPHWQLAQTQLHWWCQFNGDRNLAQQESLVLAGRAHALDPNDPDCYETMGMALTKNGRHSEAIEWYRRGIAIDPCAANCHASIGEHGLLSGNPQGALTGVIMAISLNPFPPPWYFDHLGRAQLLAGDAENAVISLSRPDIFVFAGFHLAAALAACDRSADAHRIAEQFVKLKPHWSIEQWIANEFFQNEAAANFWRQAFMKAGLPK